MFARAAFSFHPARPRTPSRLPSTSFLSPTYKHFARNFIVSPTYAKTGGCHPPKNVGAPTFPRFSFPSTLSVLFVFNCLSTLSFSVSPLSPIPPTSSTLFTKNPGGPPPVQPILPKHVTHTPLFLGPRSPLPPVTSHQSPVTLSSPARRSFSEGGRGRANLSVAPSLAPAGHWYFIKRHRQ